MRKMEDGGNAASAEIQTYLQQIASIDEQLRSVELSDADRAELEQLKNDLHELLELVYDGATTDSAIDDQTASSSQTVANNRAETQGDEEDAELDEDEDESDLGDMIGMRCRAPYGTQFGHKLPLQLHNAVILDVVDPSRSIDQMEVRVLYSNPMFLAMKPCQFYLEDRCSFDDTCRFSHGEKVPLADLLEYESPDFNSLKEGSSILAVRDEKDGLWELGVVTSIQDDQIAVNWLQTQTESAVQRKFVLPLNIDLSHYQDSAEDSLSDGRTEMSNGFASFNTGPLSETMGGWEQHTKGIGSKLMAKMGYLVGKGLGKTSSGIVEPIKARVLPKGQSLDHCGQKEGGRSKSSLRRAKQKTRRDLLRRKLGEAKNDLDSGIFSFLNRKLEQNTETDEAATAVRQRSALRAESAKSLNIKLFALDESIMQAEKKLKQYELSAKRNEQKDIVTADRMRAKQNQVQAELASLRRQRSQVSSEQNARSTAKKTSIF